MNAIYQNVVLLLFTFTLASCANDLTKTTMPVTAGKLYKGSYINVHAPNSLGWHLLASSPEGIEFARSGDNPGESLGAQVLMFHLEETQDSSEFVSLIQRGFENDTDLQRFEILDLEFSYTDERGYPCVRVSFLAKDKQARTSPTSWDELLLQAESLYCRHPARPDTGFSINYSHRGKSTLSNLDAEAQDFFNGIQVPDL